MRDFKMDKLTYRDTRDYVAIDVDKGIDHRTGQLVHADAVAPEGYAVLPKCKHCKHYLQDEGAVGNCMADEQEFIAYGDMAAITCRDYTQV
jgi:4-hydroxyphenylacetate decarboxylase small subunit